jgi:hypothetical protein
LLDQSAAFRTRDAAMKQDVPPPIPLQTADDEFVRADPLAEHHDLGFRVFENFGEKLD